MIKSDFVLALKNELLFTKKDAIVFAEDKDDANFWQGIFSKFAPHLKLDFYNGTLPLGGNKEAKGRKAVLAYLDFADLQLLLCVDSDYHYLLEDDTITNNFVFQTYVYAIENYQCFAPSLKQICQEVTQTEGEIIDFEDFLQRYSEIIYDLFVLTTLDKQEIEKIWNTISLKGNFNVSDEGNNELRLLETRVNEKYNELKINFLESDIEKQKNKFLQKGLLADHTYLFVRGKNLKGSIVIPLLKSITSHLKSMKLKDLRKNLSDEEFESAKKAIEGQDKNISEMITQNINFYDCFLISLIAKDIQKFTEFKSSIT